MTNTPQPAQTSGHSALIASRWVGLAERVQAKVELFAGKDRSGEQRLFDQAAVATSAVKRIHWLRKAAETATKEPSKLAACRKGCSHCCHVSVVLSKSEAAVIAKETGHRINSQAGRFSAAGTLDPISAKAEVVRQYQGQACVFLRQGECSIYEHRPLVCRWQINLDEDDLLCRLVDGQDAPQVPYLDMTAHEYGAAMVTGVHQTYDDIRAWFAR